MNRMALENRFPDTAVWVLVFALLAALCGEQARSAGGGDADARELSRYQLTMVDVRKYAAANATLAKQPKAEQDDVSLAERHIERDRLAREHVLAEQKAGGKHVLVRVAHQHRAVETLERLERRATAEEHRRALRHPRGHAL